MRDLADLDASCRRTIRGELTHTLGGYAEYELAYPHETDPDPWGDDPEWPPLDCGVPECPNYGRRPCDDDCPTGGVIESYRPLSGPCSGFSAEVGGATSAGGAGVATPPAPAPGLIDSQAAVWETGKRECPWLFRWAVDVSELGFRAAAALAKGGR